MTKKLRKDVFCSNWHTVGIVTLFTQISSFTGTALQENKRGSIKAVFETQPTTKL